MSDKVSSEASTPPPRAPPQKKPKIDSHSYFDPTPNYDQLSMSSKDKNKSPTVSEDSSAEFFSKKEELILPKRAKTFSVGRSRSPRRRSFSRSRSVSPKTTTTKKEFSFTNIAKAVLPKAAFANRVPLIVENQKIVENVQRR